MSKADDKILARIAALKPVRQAFDRGGAPAMFAALAEAEAQARKTGRGNAVLSSSPLGISGPPSSGRTGKTPRSRAARVLA